MLSNRLGQKEGGCFIKVRLLKPSINMILCKYIHNIFQSINVTDNPMIAEHMGNMKKKVLKSEKTRGLKAH